MRKLRAHPRHCFRERRQRVSRRTVAFCFVLAQAVLTGACSGTQAPTPTPDPFSTVGQRSAELRQQGEDLLQQGRTRDALDTLQRARLLSPIDDPELDATIAQLNEQVAPTPVPVPATATPVPAPATATPSPMPTATLEVQPTANPSPSPLPPTATVQALPTSVPALPAAPPPRAPPSQPTQRAPSIVYVPVPAPAPTPVPTALAAQPIYVAAGPVAVAVADSGVAYIADLSGLIWIVDRSQPTLRRPFMVPGQPAGLALDQSTKRLFVALRGQPALIVLDADSGQQVGSVGLPGDPDDVRLDDSDGVLFVVVPQRASIERFASDTLRPLEPILKVPTVTGLAVDAGSHTLYATLLDGELVVIDAPAGVVRERRVLTGVGLSGVATAAGRVLAINTPGAQVLSLDLQTGEVSSLPVDAPPAAIVMGAISGAAYVLEPAADAVVRMDTANGAELARVALGEAHVEETLQPDQLWLRPRMAIGATDESVFVVAPSSGVVGRLTSPL